MFAWTRVLCHTQRILLAIYGVPDTISEQGGSSALSYLEALLTGFSTYTARDHTARIALSFGGSCPVRALIRTLEFGKLFPRFS
jgi:hypothetical protein